MRVIAGEPITGPAGTATPVFPFVVHDPDEEPPEDTGSVATWILECPGQSPAWSHYQLAIVHLRPLPNGPPAQLRAPDMTHEVVVAALDPDLHPDPADVETWVRLFPINVTEQVKLPGDDEARDLLAEAARKVVEGVLPAEPALSGQREPWLSWLTNTARVLGGQDG
jgi:hypothetical protein